MNYRVDRRNWWYSMNRCSQVRTAGLKNAEQSAGWLEDRFEVSANQIPQNEKRMNSWLFYTNDGLDLIGKRRYCSAYVVSDVNSVHGKAL